MTASPPDLEQFRIEPARDGLIHLVFNMPGRSMNVFSNAAIHELGRFAAWLKTSDVRGVVVRSGKPTAFCAGADLSELGVAYEMIVAAPQPERFQIAFNHFIPLSRAIRALETSGKPVAAAIGGLALGGGCELTMGAHYRVLADTPKVAMGLPESLVGLLPGAGGTQRLPRLVGIDQALPILLQGARLSGEAARAAGLVDEVVAPGEEVAAAERWLVSPAATAVQPWDQAGWKPQSANAVSARVASAREQVLAETLGHEPAPLAILDCIEQGLTLPIDDALRTEMTLFSALIQRREPRDMIQILFVGKLDHERAVRAGTVSEPVATAIARLRTVIHQIAACDGTVLAAAGFRTPEFRAQTPVQSAASEGYWIDGGSDDPGRRLALDALRPLVAEVHCHADRLTDAEKRQVDFAIVSDGVFPAYLGGPVAFGGTR